MRQLIAIALFCQTVATAAEPRPCAALYVKGDQLWAAVDGEARFLFSDSLGVEKPRWSPDGNRIVYVHRMRPQKDHLTDVMVTDTHDLSTKAVAKLTWEDSVKAVLQVAWRGNDAVWIEGHVNPSTNIYYEWNVATGERVRDLPGARFSWSPDGRHLVYTEHRAHFSPDAGRAAGLMIDDEPLWTPPKGERIASPLAWSEDSTSLAFVTAGEDGAKLRVLDTSRRVERNPVRLESGPITRLRWTDKGRVTVDGAATDLVEVASGRVTRQPRAAQSVIREGETSFIAADSTCGER
ncbi:MAG TPA: hypothetical protein VF266_15185 [Thermoanaerobaculia bacterium]